MQSGQICWPGGPAETGREVGSPKGRLWQERDRNWGLRAQTLGALCYSKDIAGVGVGGAILFQ